MTTLREELAEIIRWRFRSADGKPLNGPSVVQRAMEIADELAPSSRTRLDGMMRLSQPPSARPCGCGVRRDVGATGYRCRVSRERGWPVDDQHSERSLDERVGAFISGFRAGAAALRAQGWQPITTAPRDWTSVLVYDHASAAVGQAYFRSDDDDGVWCWANLNQMDEDGVVGEPTHWMPLPSPPEAD